MARAPGAQDDLLVLGLDRKLLIGRHGAQRAGDGGSVHAAVQPFDAFYGVGGLPADVCGENLSVTESQAFKDRQRAFP